MISITVTSYNGTSTTPITGHFDETGGNIGRAENNQLVLPDPERTISRVHAQIVFRNGRYAVIDRGSNPISVNGRPLGNGQEALLNVGDEINIGGYAMRVEAGAPAGGAAVADPFADFAGLAAGASRGGPAGRPAAPAAVGFADPMAGFSAAPPASAAQRPPAPAPAAAASVASAGGIPLDWDPFAPDPKTAGPGGGDFARSLGQPPSPSSFGLDVGGRAEPLIAGLGGSGGGGDSLDALFGLSPGGSRDPLAGSALNEAAAQPNMAAHADPLKSLNSMTRGNASAKADTSSDLQSPFMLPPMSVPAAARPATAAPAPAPAPMAARPAAPAIPQQATFISGFGGQPLAAAVPPPARVAARVPDAIAPPDSVLSWSDPSGESRTVIRPRGAPATAPPASTHADLDLDFATPAAPAPSPVPSPVPTAPPPVASTTRPPPVAGTPAWQPPPQRRSPPAPTPVASPAAPTASAPASQAPAPSADIAALTAALREGLGVHNLPPETLVLTPALMRLMGRLVHEATRGTIDLLVARAALKREIRAEVTMIVTRENNPLKFSPSVDVALGHLLNPPVRGFMDSDKAMRDAYDDLRAHQFGFLAGMRAALEGILKRFDPARLEGKLTEKSFLSALLPAKRKARMWDAFTEMYGQISAEATDDFHELFGKEFLRAYNEYIDQLAKDRP